MRRVAGLARQTAAAPQTPCAKIIHGAGQPIAFPFLLAAAVNGLVLSLSGGGFWDRAPTFFGAPGRFADRLNNRSQLQPDGDEWTPLYRVQSLSFQLHRLHDNLATAVEVRFSQ